MAATPHVQELFALKKAFSIQWEMTNESVKTIDMKVEVAADISANNDKDRKRAKAPVDVDIDADGERDEADAIDKNKMMELCENGKKRIVYRNYDDAETDFLKLLTEEDNGVDNGVDETDSDY